MKDVKVFKEFDISTPEGLNLYTLCSKLPLIMKALTDFKSILLTVYPIIEGEIEVSGENISAEEMKEINLEKIELNKKIIESNKEQHARNEERKELLSALESMLKVHEVNF
jgi:hypothetical protein